MAHDGCISRSHRLIELLSLTHSLVVLLLSLTKCASKLWLLLRSHRSPELLLALPLRLAVSLNLFLLVLHAHDILKLVADLVHNHSLCEILVLISLFMQLSLVKVIILCLLEVGVRRLSLHLHWLSDALQFGEESVSSLDTWCTSFHLTSRHASNHSWLSSCLLTELRCNAFLLIIDSWLDIDLEVILDSILKGVESD